MLTINNTLDGYLKDVEIKGNTIQDAENLADIRSVGDKVEGQELYEIPVLSCGKNLFNPKEHSKDTYTFGSPQGAYYGRKIKVPKPNTKYTLFVKESNLPSGHWVVINAYENGKILQVFNVDNTGTSGNNSLASVTVTSSEDCYIQITVYIHNNNNASHWEAYLNLPIQLEEGTVATPYEPYQEDKLTILSPVQLEKVGDVADRIIEKDGVWGVEKNVETFLYRNEALTMTGINNVGLYKYQINKTLNRVPSSSYINSVFLQGTSNDIATTNKELLIVRNADIIIVLKEQLTIEEFKNKYSNVLTIKYPTTNPQFIPFPHDQQVKLRTFANKTNISFLTEIEGTIKAQVPKSLGATVNTHTEQISNLNKELDRVKKLEESTVSTVTTESDFTTVEATSNGYFEDVKLEGKTLVNLISTDNIPSNDGILVESNYVQLNANSDYIKLFYGGVDKLKPSTTYTLIVDVKNNTLDSNYIVSSKHGSASFDDYFYISSGTVGKFIYTITTKDDLSSCTYAVRSYVDSSCTTGSIVVRNMLLEGDHTQNPPSFFEGLKSVSDGVDEIVVSTTSKYNYFDYSLISKGRYLDSSSISTLKYNGSICVEKGEVIDVNIDKSLTIAFYSFSDENGYTQISEFKSGCFTFSIPTDVSNIGYEIKKTGGGSIVVDYIKDKKISIISMQDKKRLLYYNEETQTWEKPILRQWDSIEKHADGKYYYHQRSGEVVLNGSENWKEFEKSDTHVKASLIVNDVKNNSNLICDRFKYYELDYAGVWGYEGVSSVNSHYGIIINCQASKLSTQDVAGFKQWLQTNNVTVVYQLAQEKVYECTNIDLITYANETNYIVESGVLSPKSTLKVHNNISNVVSLLQKKVSLLESNMTKYMITQNRLQLSSTYSADSVTFKVDYFAEKSVTSYDNDLFNLILNNIIVGKENYDYDKMFNIIMDYASWSQISWDQFDILVGMMDLQHNPPIEPPIEEVPSETPEE